MEIPLPTGATLGVPSGTVDAVAGGLLALGVANCLFGRRVFRFTVTLLGVLAAGAASAYGVLAGMGNRPTALVTGALLGGVLAAALLVLFYRAALFVIGGAAGFGLGLACCALTGMEPNLGLFAACAVAGGVLTLAVERFAVIVISSVLGSLGVAAGGLYFLRQGPTMEQLQATGGDLGKLRALVDTPVYMALGGAALLLLVSLFVQFKWTGRKRAAHAEAEAAAEE